jgi:hypothetical protein
MHTITPILAATITSERQREAVRAHHRRPSRTAIAAHVPWTRIRRRRTRRALA